MHVGGHAVDGGGFLDDADELLPGLADVEVGSGRAGEQPVEVAVEMDEPAFVKAKALPHAVTDEEGAVEHGHLRLVAWVELAVDVDAHVGVSRVFQCFVGSFGHGSRLRRGSA